MAWVEVKRSTLGLTKKVLTTTSCYTIKC